MKTKRKRGVEATALQLILKLPENTKQNTNSGDIHSKPRMLFYRLDVSFVGQHTFQN